MRQGLSIFLFLTSVWCWFPASAQFVFSAPKEVEAKFDSAYPTAKDVWWDPVDDTVPGEYCCFVDFFRDADNISVYIDYKKGHMDEMKIFNFTPGITNVPRNIKAKFDSLFPSAKHVHWASLDTTKDSLRKVIVDFYLDPKQGRVSLSEMVFGSKCEIEEMEVNCTDNLIPQKLKDYISKNYLQYDHDFIVKTTNKRGDFEYMTELWKGKKKGMVNFTHLTFDTFGNLTSKYKKKREVGVMSDPVF